MEKLGVQTSLPADKTASNDPRCPTCGEKITQHGAVHTCIQCGTEPFEDEVSQPEDD